jgi:methylthioribose-1-phosphate isomerase
MTIENTVISTLTIPGAPAIAIVAALAHAVELHNGGCSECPA